MDLTLFYFIFILFSHFPFILFLEFQVFFSLFWTQAKECDVTSCVTHVTVTIHNHVIQKRSQKILEQIILYNVTTACCCSNHQTQCPMISLTSKSQNQISSEKFTRELDKEPSLHCSSIYITYRWSMLQQCVYLMSIHHASTLRLPCFLHVP